MKNSDSVDLFSIAAVRSLMGYTQIDTYRNTALNSFDSFNSQLKLEAQELADEFAYDDYYSRIFDQSKLSDEAVGEGTVAELIHKQKYLGFMYSLNSSCLVFTHSILDGVLYDFCRSVFEAAPNKWEQFVLERSVKLNRLKDREYEDVLAELVQSKFKDIDRSSVPSKTDVLFKLCSPLPDNNEPHGYVFCRDKLSEICEKRNRIVHSPQEYINLEDIDLDLKFLQETGRYFLSVLNSRFDLKIDPGAIVQAQLPNGGLEQSLTTHTQP